MILRPGYLRWDGVKYTTDSDIEIVGPAGPPGPSGIPTTETAGNGLLFANGSYNVGQNIDDSIVINENDIQLKLIYQDLLDEATSEATGQTLALRNIDGTIKLAGETGTITYGGQINIDAACQFTLQQTARTSNLATKDLNFIAQAPYALATLTNRKSGDFNLSLKSPSNGGTTEGSINIKRDSTTVMSFSPTSSIGGMISFPATGTIGAIENLNIDSSDSIVIGCVNNSTISAGGNITLTTNVGTLDILGSSTTVASNIDLQLNSGGDAYLTSNGTMHILTNGQGVEIDAVSGQVDITGSNIDLIGAVSFTTNSISLNSVLDVLICPPVTVGSGGIGAAVILRGGSVSGGISPVGGDTIIGGSVGGINGNIGLGGAVSGGGGGKIIFIANATTIPSTNPTAGGILYVQSGSLKFRGSSGTITTLGVA